MLKFLSAGCSLLFFLLLPGVALAQAPTPVLLGSVATPGTITTDGSNLYIGSGNDVVSMPIAGGAASTLYPAATPCCVVGITQAGGNLFWIDPNGDPDATAIFSGPAGGGTPAKIYSGFATGQPIVDGSGIATDGTRLYAADEVGGGVVAMNLDGTGITVLGSRYGGGFSTEHLNRIAVSGGVIYVADEGCNCSGGTITPQIVSIPVGGGAFTTLFDAGAGFAVRPHDIAVVGSTIFFTDSVNNTIWKMPTSGGTPTVFIAGAPFTRVESLTALGNTLYVTDSGAGAVYKVPVSASACPSDTLAVPPNGTIAGTNWDFDYAVTVKDGLQLSNVRLGSRLMASSMTLPYYNLVDRHGRTLQRCELQPDGDSASTCRSRLVAFDNTPSGTTEVVKATYEVDNLPGAPDTCLRITQQYEFDTELDPAVNPLNACEPTLGFACAKYRPLVSYEFVLAAGASTPIFSGGINVVQRLQLDVTPPGTTTPVPANAALVSSECPSLKCLTKPVLALGGNPLPFEVRFNAISNGKRGDEDNYHQTYKALAQEPAFTLGKGKTCPTLISPGCPECAHIHWFWNSIASFVSTCNGGPALGNGAPMIPSGSNQDVEVGVSLSRPGEEHPFDFRTLINSESLTGGVPVFWNSSTSRSQSDLFFLYGGFFSSSPPP
jgi:hypothetical protein